LAARGKIPFAASFACFLMCNAYDQIRMSVAFPGLNVKLVSSHGGISIGEDGPSQMGIEAVALACTFPGMAVIVPADAASTKAATAAMLAHHGPTYLRLGRPKVPAIYSDGCDFEIGRSIQLRDGSDVTRIANGLMVAMALDAAEPWLGAVRESSATTVGGYVVAHLGRLPVVGECVEIDGVRITVVEMSPAAVRWVVVQSRLAVGEAPLESSGAEEQA